MASIKSLFIRDNIANSVLNVIDTLLTTNTVESKETAPITNELRYPIDTCLSLGLPGSKTYSQCLSINDESKDVATGIDWKTIGAPTQAHADIYNDKLEKAEGYVLSNGLLWPSNTYKLTVETNNLENGEESGPEDTMKTYTFIFERDCTDCSEPPKSGNSIPLDSKGNDWCRQMSLYTGWDTHYFTTQEGQEAYRKYYPNKKFATPIATNDVNNSADQLAAAKDPVLTPAQKGAVWS